MALGGPRGSWKPFPPGSVLALELGGVGAAGQAPRPLELSRTGRSGPTLSAPHLRGNLLSRHFGSSGSPAPAQGESGAEFIDTQVPAEKPAEKHHCQAHPHPGPSRKDSGARSHYCSGKVTDSLVCPRQLLLRGLRPLRCVGSTPLTPTPGHLYLMVLDELCTHPTECRFNEGILFLLPALPSNGF